MPLSPGTDEAILRLLAVIVSINTPVTRPLIQVAVQAGADCHGGVKETPVVPPQVFVPLIVHVPEFAELALLR